MRYVVLMYTDPEQTKAMSAAELDEVGSKHRELRTELTTTGELVGGEAMAYPEDTVTLRLAGQDVAISHGPLLKSDEQLSACCSGRSSRQPNKRACSRCPSPPRSRWHSRSPATPPGRYS